MVRSGSVLLTLSLLFLSSLIAFGDAKDDQTAIDNLIESFRTAGLNSTDMAVFLAPDVSPDVHQTSLELIHKPYETFVVLRTGDLKFTNVNEAEAQLESHLESPTKSLRITKTAHFRKVNGRWYFADFEFLRFPYALFTAIAVAGFCLAMTLTIVYLRRRKRHQVAVA